MLQKKGVKLALICLGLAALTAFAYWPVRHHQFILFDDDLYITDNYEVQQGLTLEGATWAFSTIEGGNWHPLTWLSHMLDVELFGLKSGPHHLVNLFFHLANTLLLVLLLRKMTGALWRSAFVAALFALHPLHVESVAWIAERKDVLSAFFFFLTLWFYVRYVLSETKNSKLKLLNYFLALLFLALGLMSKPMLVTLPCLLLLLDFWPLNRLKLSSPFEIRNLKFVLLEKLPFLGLAIASSVLACIAQRSSGAMLTLEQLALPHRIGNAAVALVSYLGKMVWPRDLAVLYPLQVLPGWKIVGAFVLLLAISAAALRLAARRPYFLIGWLWFLGMLVPVIGLVHVGNQAMADRYTYLPMIGIFAALAWGAFDLLRSARFRWALAGIVLGFSLILTRAQVGYWRDGETLFRHTLGCTKENLFIQSSLAAELIAQNRLDEAMVLLKETLTESVNSLNNLGSALERQGKTNEAMQVYQRSVQLSPKNAEAQNNLGYMFLLRGNLDEAVPHFLTALESKPYFAEPHYNLGNLYFMQGKMDEALSHYQAAVKYRPAYVEAQSNLAATLLQLGQPGPALTHAQTAVRLNPDFAPAQNNCSEVLLRLGRYAEAESHSRKAVQLQPDSSTFQNVLGRALAGQKKWVEATAAFSRAVELEPEFAEVHFNFANTLWAQGRSSEAKVHYLSALQLQPAFPEAEMQLAMLFLREKNNSEAIFHLKKIVAQRPQWKEASNNLAWLLATSTDPKLRDATNALARALQTVRVSSPDDFSALDTLAAAYAGNNQFEQAQSTAVKALDSARRSGDTNSAAQIASRLELYRQSRPYRE
jgi:protein O-mannosyl-transferase